MDGLPDLTGTAEQLRFITRTRAMSRRAFLRTAATMAASFKGQGVNPHQAFLDFWNKGTGKDALTPFFVSYFARLKAAMLSNVTKPLATAPAVAVI